MPLFTRAIKWAFTTLLEAQGLMLATRAVDKSVVRQWKPSILSQGLRLSPHHHTFSARSLSPTVFTTVNSSSRRILLAS